MLADSDTPRATAAPATIYRRHPATVLTAVVLGLRDLKLDHLYALAFPDIGVLSVAYGVTAWCDGRTLTWHQDGEPVDWPIADALGAAEQLAALAQQAGQ